MLLFHTDNLPHYGLERIFEFASKAKFDGIEIGINNVFDTQNPEYLKSLEHKYSLPIKAFSLSEKYEEVLTKAFQLTVREFPQVTLNLNSPQVLSFGYRKWLSSIVPKLAAKYDLNVCRKNAPFKTMMGILPQRSENSLMSLSATGSVCLDLTALAISNEEIMRSVQSLRGSLKQVYLSNVEKNAPYSLPQRGILPIESFLTKLSRDGFKGNFTLRVQAKHLFEGEDEKVLSKMIESRDFYQKYFIFGGESPVVEKPQAAKEVKAERPPAPKITFSFPKN